MELQTAAVGELQTAAVALEPAVAERIEVAVGQTAVAVGQTVEAVGQTVEAAGRTAAEADPRRIEELVACSWPHHEEAEHSYPDLDQAGTGNNFLLSIEAPKDTNVNNILLPLSTEARKANLGSRLFAFKTLALGKFSLVKFEILG